MPPWNPLFGNLLSFLPLLKEFPDDAIQNYLVGALNKDFDKSDSLFYIDLWPFSNPFIVITTPSLAVQACQQNDLPKPEMLKPFLSPFAGGDNLFTMNGAQWKHSRALFSSGFSAGYVMGLMPHIVEEASVFVDVLREHARKGDLFSLDEASLLFTMDVIGAVALNTRFNAQRKPNPFTSAMRSQISWATNGETDELNPFMRYSPIPPIVKWWNGRIMDKYVSKELDKRFAEWQGNVKDLSSRSIIDLVIRDYKMENPNAIIMDPVFKKWAIVQIRLFVFAGHDSTGSTITYCYHLLSQNPEAMAKIRAEHNTVFGTDLSQTTRLLLENPNLIHKLPYTQAVQKEVLRMFPPASGLRRGQPGVSLQDPSGNLYPTENMNLLILHMILHRHPKYWVSPNSFIPERWLVGPEHPLYPVKGAWRPFEFGPRSCVGQNLVTLDITTVLVMTLR